MCMLTLRQAAESVGRSNGRGRRAIGWLKLGCLAGLLVCLANVPAALSAEGEEEEIPPPKQLVRSTPDGVQLSITYFPGLKGKDSIPVVLLHMYRGSGTEFKTLAPYLQRLGHAVIVPDLRGHGGSTVWQIPGRPEPQTLEGRAEHGEALPGGLGDGGDRGRLLGLVRRGRL